MPALASTHFHWHLEPLLLAPIAALVAVYAWRFSLARTEAGGRGAGIAQAAAFAGAIVVILIAVVSPLDALGEQRLFAAHMAQHILLGDLAPLLLLLALSRVIMRPLTRRLVAVERALGRLAHPVTALVAWLGLVYLWHIPALYEAAIANPLVHLLEHGSFFAAGLALWWPLIQPVPMRHGLRGLGPFAYIGAAKAGLAALGVFLTWSDVVVYDYYATVPRTWGLSPLEDQNVGGAMMMVEQSLVLVVTFIVLFVRMLARSEEDERRRERLDDGDRLAGAAPVG